MVPDGEAVDTTTGANAPIALQHFLAQIASVGSEPPLLYAPVRAKGEAAFWDLETAPAAQVAAVRTFGKAVAIGPSTGHGSRGAHSSSESGTIGPTFY